MQFQLVALPDSDKVLQIQTVPANHDLFYRLSHRLNARAALPQPMYDPAEYPSSYQAGSYLDDVQTSDSIAQGIDPTAYGAGVFANLVSQLNASDLVYKYRSPTRDEFKELAKIPGSALTNIDGACVFEGEVNSDALMGFYTHTGGRDFQVGGWRMSCVNEGFLLVREAKAL